MSAIEFRPRSVSELVDASFQVLRQHFGPLAVVAAITVAPSVVINVLTTRIADSITNPGAGATDPNAALARAALVIPISLVGTCWSFVGLGALVSAIADACAGRAVEPGAAFRRALSRAWTLIGANLLVYVIAFGAFVVAGILAAVFIPLVARGGRGAGGAGAAALVGLLALAIVFGGMVWMVIAIARYYVVAPSVMLEGLGARASLRRSRALTAGHKGRIVGMLLLVLVVAVVLYGTLYVLAQTLTHNRHVVTAVFGALGIPLYPLVVGLMTLLYYDLRIRKEGYDIELMAQQIGGGTGGSPAPVASAPPTPATR